MWLKRLSFAPSKFWLLFMKITYDPEVDALYIRFQDTTVTTQHLAEGFGGRL
jgi:hypothetical protein